MSFGMVRKSYCVRLTLQVKELVVYKEVELLDSFFDVRHSTCAVHMEYALIKD